MNVEEILQWADELVLSKTGSHLNSLEQAILTGVWNSQKYKEIAHDYHCSEANVKRVAGNLWNLVSEELDEKVNKSNFRATMDRRYISNSKILNFVVKRNFNQANINLCRENHPDHESAAKTSPDPISTSKKPEKCHDLTQAPKPHPLYNRTLEITTLKQWILEEKIPLVTIFGLPGIGKTALARALVEEIQENFEYILWCNFTSPLEVKSLEKKLIEFFEPNRATKQPSLIEYLQSYRSLIIIDDLQEIFTCGESAGTYLPNWENYGKFWQQIGRLPHKSCFLLLTWEKPTENCRTLQLGGLGEAAREILTKKGLKDEDKWGKLIQLCGGNPSWLNLIAATIVDLFNGSIHRFLSYDTLFLGDLEPILESCYQRLSSSEKIVTLWLANQKGADIADKPAELDLSEYDFLTAVHSLRKRGLLEKLTDNGVSLFALQPLFKEYSATRPNRGKVNL